jgi:saccharopine dehydrogenase-like NADP-dependent oxidoreductase
VSHAPHFDTCSAQQLLAEWSRSKATLEDIIGAPVLVGSIPGGYYARRVVQAAHEAGLHYLFTSEPEQAPHQVDGCEVRGRFTLRRDSPADLAGRFVSLTPGARWQQWLAWNAKKALKKTLGPGYLQLADWLARKPSR